MAQEAEVNAAVRAGPMNHCRFARGPVDEHIELADVGALAGRAVELAAGGEDAVANALGIEPTAVVAGEPLVVRIGPHLRGGGMAAELVRAAENDGAYEFFN